MKLKSFDHFMILLLRFSIAVTLFFVMVGGIMTLTHLQAEIIHPELLDNSYKFSLQSLISKSNASVAINRIEMGLLSLALIQLIRVLAYFGFFFVKRDFKFVIISCIIFCLLLFSLLANAS